MFLILMGAMFGSQIFMPLLRHPILGILVGTLVLMGLYMGWLLSIAVEANQKLGGSLKRSTKGMVFGLIYAVIYLIGALVFLPGSVEPGKGIPGFIIPMHLLAMAAIFYALLFTAKSLVTLEKNEAVGFFEYSGPFFLIWFFPIGVWFVQPRVNRLLGGGNSA